ncbi:MAG TPA: argininosuccinate synthase [Candidatus Thermoplasmatota archaeon]|nr:argininosuccinate synthase [Candidatus Thermoplasmatota archaeon]
MPKHIVLAYSGGLDTSVMVHWLKAQHGAKVTAAILDLGQGAAHIAEAKARALANGAAQCVVLPAKEEFARDFLAPAIRANALYEGVYPLATALGRPLIAKKLVEAVRQVGGDAVAHGCTGKGNDQVRIEAGVKALLPGLPCLAPQRSHPMTRDATVAYARKHRLQVPRLKRSTYSTDENLWGRSVEGGDTEDPAHPVHEDAYLWTVSPQDAPDAPAALSILFEAGLPVAVDGKRMPLWDLVAHVGQLAGAHGVGRIDHVENRLVGIKSREIYEAPAAVTLLFAKRALEALTLTKEEMRLKPFLEQQFSQNVYDGLWYAPVMEALRAGIDTMQRHVAGTVTVRLHKGSATLLGRTSPLSLFKDNLATYGAKDAFNHQASEGFIELWSLPTETANAVRQAQPARSAAPHAAAGKSDGGRQGSVAKVVVKAPGGRKPKVTVKART